eukprot:TRINITY_DN6366_c0_g1_i1.p1 TRINITY_DN6366_c0_g1~~TRINITY_DN6366_c0_g1_i1.p1  ORF type:complete len:435 (+),score=86.30 TRINITY_DN6366_c0_g1_i1:240-1544(+)
MATVLEIESADVIRLIGQFLQENKLENTFIALQNESQVSLNTVENLDILIENIKSGRWQQVLQTISTLKLPVTFLFDIYEQIVMEMVELDERDVAQNILKKTGAMMRLKSDEPARWIKLDSICGKQNISSRDIYGKKNREKRRDALVDGLLSHVNDAPHSRLLNLLGDALKYQQLQGRIPPGSSYDLFRGCANAVVEVEMAPTMLDKTLKFPTDSYPEVVKFSPDGLSLVVGSMDGYIEIYDYITGKLKPLQYQDKGMFMNHKTKITCMGFTRESECLVTGANDGEINVWRISNGHLLRKFTRAHNSGVTSVSFSRDGFKILSSGFDMSVRIHGLKSGKTLKIFTGHTSYVSTAQWIKRGSQIVSCSSDGTVKIWDTKTTTCLRTFNIENHVNTAIHSLSLIPETRDQILLCNRSNTLYITNLNGEVCALIAWI